MAHKKTGGRIFPSSMQSGDKSTFLDRSVQKNKSSLELLLDKISSDKIKGLSKKELLMAFIEIQQSLVMELISLNRKIAYMIENKIKEEYGKSIHTLETCRDFAVIVFSILKQKGILSRAEIDDVIEKLKKQNKDVEEILRG